MMWEEIIQGVSTDIPDDASLSAWTSDAVSIAAAEIGNLGGSTYVTDSNSMDLGSQPTAPAAGTEVAGTGPAAQTGGQETNAHKLEQQILNGPQEDAGDVTRSAADVARGASGNVMGSATKPEGESGIINSFLKNPTAMAIAGTGIAGALGGAGKAALEKEIAARNIQARKDLLTMQTNETQRLSREGAFKGKPGVAPSGQRILYRPDGTPVFAGGLINNQIPQQ